MFIDLCGVSKAQSSVDYAMLEYCIREDLKMKKPRMMAVLDPIKLVIDNYPEDQIEYLDVANNLENEELGSRKVPFGRELYIERDDFMEEPPKKYFRLFPGNEVRLMHAYFVKCVGFEKDEEGNVTALSEPELFPASSVVISISQGPKNKIVSTTQGLETTSHGLLATDEHGNTTRPGVFASGDVVLGARTVVEAVHYSKEVANAMDEYLKTVE